MGKHQVEGRIPRQGVIPVCVRNKSVTQHIFQSANNRSKMSVVESLNQVVMLGLMLVVLGLLWSYRDRVIFLFTGDDRLHGNTLDAVWYGVFRCCGTCDGAWCVPIFLRRLECRIFSFQTRSLGIPFTGQNS